MNVELKVAAKDALGGFFRDRFTALAAHSLSENGRFAWALPGGSAAEVLLPALVGAPVDWGRVEFFWGDERAVGEDHPDSNYGLCRRLLLDHVPHDPRRIHRIPGESPDLVRAAADYERTLEDARADHRSLDLALLGVGPDGHVCSLFPGHPLLAEARHSVAAVFDSPKPPPARITLTLRALAETDVVFVAAFGTAKAEVVRAALHDEDSELPVARVARGARAAVFLLDPEAAPRTAAGR